MINEKKIRPFLRWAGGKSWMQKYLANLSEIQFNQYHEPFLGGGSTFFFLQPLGKSYLSDLNSELINTYVSIRDNVNEVIGVLKTFENTKEFYYKIRDTQFDTAATKAAKFIFLNQTSFNGIYRVNLNGVYNVPYGFRTKNFLDDELLFRVSSAIKNADFAVSDFDLIRNNIQPRDLVFLDPPYTVSHNFNGFIKYNEKLFSLEDQYRLSKLIDFIQEKGAYYILTNAAHDKVKEIFKNAENVLEVSRANLIGGVNAQRGAIQELIFTNIEGWF